MQIFLVTLFLFCSLAASGLSVAKYDCKLSTFEQCNGKLFMIGDDTFVFPKSTNEMNKRCK